MRRSKKGRRRAWAYVNAGKEIRDHTGEVIRTVQEVQGARAFRIDRAIGLRVSDQTGVGWY